jgi:CheY-like chemotaxis protein
MSAVRVLYVDDDDFIRELVEFALGMDDGLEVRTASSGGEAIQLVGDGWAPALFLLDVMMPQMDGPTTLQALRRLPGHEKTPAAFVTARAQPHEHEALLGAGATAVLTKPFDPLTLAAQVRGLLSA